MSKQTQGPFPSGALYFDRGKTLLPKLLSLQGEIHGLFSSWQVRQEFRNDSGAPIETGYLFALPWKTALLGMNMRIGARSFHGKVIEKKDFRGYMNEDLVDSIIIRFDEQAYGIYGANLGVLGINESISVDLRCAFFLEYESAQIHLFIPAWNIGACESFNMTISLHGETGKGNVHSPTYPVAIESGGACKLVSLKSSQPPDRDFSLYVQGMGATSHALLTRDDIEPVMAASFAPLVPENKELPIFLKLLVDCSGSMEGEAIGGVKRGLLEVLKLLKPEDHISYSRFGSAIEHLWKTPRPCDPYHREQLASAIEETDADMGGTDLETALLSMYSYITRTEMVDLAPALVLITDGQVANPEAVIQAAKRSHHRIYSIGVGDFPDKELLYAIAARTGGICKLAASEKDIARTIVRMFKELPLPVASNAEVTWPVNPDWEADIPYYLYAGETAHCLAGFGSCMGLTSKAHHGALLRYKIGDKEFETGTQGAESLASPELARFALSRLIEGVSSKRERLYLGLRLQLLCTQTALILTAAGDAGFPQSEDDFHMICNARAWNDDAFLGNTESARRNMISHSGWIERQKSAARRKAKAREKINLLGTTTGI